MTIKEIREKETGLLTEELAGQQKHLFELRGQAVTEKLEDPTQLRKARRVIAQIKTVQRERQLAETKKAEPAQATKAEPAKEKKAKASKAKAKAK